MLCKMEKEMIKLSQLDPNMTTEQLINHLLDMKVYKIINDLTPKPNIIYELSDIEQVWDILRLRLIFK